MIEGVTKERRRTKTDSNLLFERAYARNAENTAEPLTDDRPKDIDVLTGPRKVLSQNNDSVRFDEQRTAMIVSTRQPSDPHFHVL